MPKAFWFGLGLTIGALSIPAASMLGNLLGGRAALAPPIT